MLIYQIIENILFLSLLYNFYYENLIELFRKTLYISFTMMFCCRWFSSVLLKAAIKVVIALIYFSVRIVLISFPEGKDLL